jgi:hypothetical protein
MSYSHFQNLGHKNTYSFSAPFNFKLKYYKKAKKEIQVKQNSLRPLTYYMNYNCTKFTVTKL